MGILSERAEGLRWHLGAPERNNGEMGRGRHRLTKQQPGRQEGSMQESREFECQWCQMQRGEKTENCQKWNNMDVSGSEMRHLGDEGRCQIVVGSEG